VTPNQRRIAKSVNFGLLYGMSDFGSRNGWRSNAARRAR
jgi:DNA polymerase I-like protein with 3'-5' exonuclease and polymerase domains